MPKAKPSAPEQPRDPKHQAPERVWLQYFGDAEPEHDARISHSDVSWCAEKVFDHDIEYIRLDLAQEAELRAHLETARGQRNRLVELIRQLRAADRAVAKGVLALCDDAPKAFEQYHKAFVDQQTIRRVMDAFLTALDKEQQTLVPFTQNA